MRVKREWKAGETGEAYLASSLTSNGDTRVVHKQSISQLKSLRVRCLNTCCLAAEQYAFQQQKGQMWNNSVHEGC